MSSCRFLLDSNIFIRSKNELPMDVYPSFWRTLTELIEGGSFVSSEKIREEILSGNDELVDWVKLRLPRKSFLPVDVAVMKKYAELQNWAAARDFTPAALMDFASVADAFLVATAAVCGIPLVTNEKSNPFSKKRVMIPDACLFLGVEVCDLNAAFRRLDVRI